MNSCVYIIATPIAPLGHPSAGGVSQMVLEVANTLSSRFSSICIVAPDQSSLVGLSENVRIQSVPGVFVSNANIAGADNVLENMLFFVANHAKKADVVINISYDSLAFIKLQELKHCRVFHYISSAIQSLETIESVQRQFAQNPESIACLSVSQSKYLGIDGVRIVPLGFDITSYPFEKTSKNILVWAGRISKEKSPRTAFRVASELKLPLRLLGSIQDHDLWNSCIRDYADVDLYYTGYLSGVEMRQKISECSVFLMTTNSNQHFLEAFGIVAIEALACGVPVVTSRGHGPAEIIENGISGIYADGEQWAEATKLALNLDRKRCRLRVEEHFSREVFSENLRRWIS
ncbi:MAG: glycosyltransferase [Rickettsiales bacterium]|nr:glycosyltransferase [Rickettsiales bacterium]